MIWNYSPHENNLDLLKRHLETKVSKIIFQGTSTLSMQKSRQFSQTKYDKLILSKLVTFRIMLENWLISYLQWKYQSIRVCKSSLIVEVINFSRQKLPSAGKDVKFIHFCLK